jgi:uncharacterized protein (TIGR00369 family)
MPEKKRPSKRQRLVTWQDPFEEAPARSVMNGLDYMRAVREGRIPVPPVWRLIGLRLAEIDAGYAVVETEPAEYHYNRFGIVQGGMLCTILDAAMGCAVHSLLPASAGFVSLELNAAYFHPVGAGSGRIRCEGTIVHSGGRIVVAEGRMTDGQGTLCARATSTCMIQDRATDRLNHSD